MMVNPIESIIGLAGDYLALIIGEKAEKSKLLTVISIIVIIMFIIWVIYNF